MRAEATVAAAGAAPRIGNRIMAYCCLAGAVLLWGTSFMATKAAMVAFSPMAVIWLRMGLASLMVLLLMRKVPRPAYRKGDWKVLLLLCLMQPCLYFLLEGYAISLTTSAQAGMISSIVPLLVTVGAWALLKERLSARNAVGLGLSIAGVVWLSLSGAPDESAPNPVLGNMMEVGAMVAAAVYMVVMKKLSARYSTWWLTGMQCVAGAVFFLPGILLEPLPVGVDIPVGAWVAVLYLGLFVTLGAFGLYNMAMTFMPAGRAAVAINMVSPVALISGWLVLGEAMTPMQLAACALVGVGVVVGGRS